MKDRGDHGSSDWQRPDLITRTFQFATKAQKPKYEAFIRHDFCGADETGRLGIPTALMSNTAPVIVDDSFGEARRT